MQRFLNVIANVQYHILDALGMIPNGLYIVEHSHNIVYQEACLLFQMYHASQQILVFHPFTSSVKDHKWNQSKRSSAAGRQAGLVTSYHLKQLGREHIIFEAALDKGDIIRALEEAISEFVGVALVVSHDRWFLDRICTHIIAFEGESIAKMYVGNWSDYEAFMLEKFGKDLTPHRVKYRTLKR